MLVSSQLAADPAYNHGELKPNSPLNLLVQHLQALQLKDQATGQHVFRVAHLMKSWAIFLTEGSIAVEPAQAWAAGLFHDLGKLGVLDQILQKAGPLNTLERDQMENHAELGYQLLKDVPGFEQIAEAARFHHERIDGTGYPLGLKGQDIPLLARMVAIVDTFDAITSDRPYRAASSAAIAMSEIVRSAGSQLCPVLAALFIEFQKTQSFLDARVQ